jgi:hypothetical protein
MISEIHSEIHSENHSEIHSETYSEPILSYRERYRLSQLREGTSIPGSSIRCLPTNKQNNAQTKQPIQKTLDH